MNRRAARIRSVERGDEADWLRLRRAAWPGRDHQLASEVERYFEGFVPALEVAFLAEIDGRPVGFAELSIRAYAEGCSTENVGYLEAWYVDADCRQEGVGRALIEAGQQWARERRCSEFASDTQPENEPSRKAHLGCGFEEVGLVRCFRKSL